MHEGHQGVFSLFLEGHSHCRLFSQGFGRHPRMLNSSRTLDLRESAIMGRPLERPEKETVDFRIQRELLGSIPGIAGDLRIQPSIEYLSQGSRDCSFELKFKGLLRFSITFFSFFFLSRKYC